MPFVGNRYQGKDKVLTQEERNALCVCSHCGSKEVAVIPVPGGWIELICDDCGEIWWYDTRPEGKRIS